MLILILCLLLKPSLYVVWKPTVYWYYIPLALIAWIADVIIARTSWVLIGGFPRYNEITISDTLERICTDKTHRNHALCVEIALAINRVDPQHNHIRAVL